MSSSNNCPYCRNALPAATHVCPSCGAPVDHAVEIDDAGWTELPGAEDMAQLQLGNSQLQISGKYVPVADFSLAAGDTVYFAHHVLLWRDESVQVRVRSLRGAWKRLFAGMPLVMAEAEGPGHIAFSRDASGEMVAIPLRPGQEVDVREHVFLAATGNVQYDWFNTNVWYTTRNGDETETHFPLGMFMDRFQAADKPGLLLLHGVGNLFLRDLKPGETVLLKPNALLYKDPSVHMHLVIERVIQKGMFFNSVKGNGRFLWVRLTGPGRVAMQSADKHHEENLRAIQSSSGEIRDWQTGS